MRHTIHGADNEWQKLFHSSRGQSHWALAHCENPQLVSANLCPMIANNSACPAKKSRGSNSMIFLPQILRAPAFAVLVHPVVVFFSWRAVTAPQFRLLAHSVVFFSPHWGRASISLLRLDRPGSLLGHLQDTAMRLLPFLNF